MKKPPQYTPKPWTVVWESNDAIIRYSDGDLVSYVARIYDGTLCPEHGTVAGNAYAISATPELLASCQAMHYFLLKILRTGEDPLAVRSYVAHLIAESSKALKKAKNEN